MRSTAENTEYMRRWRQRKGLSGPSERDLGTLVLAYRDRPAWWSHAACRGCDPALFFPERGEQVAAAKRVCLTCPVRPECLDYALEKGEKFGIWGGKSEQERRRMRRARKKGQL
jgi:WhiB family transcriptional regulator, redox-sensing transcriptional regulator